jgi:hypothetical protein
MLCLLCPRSILLASLHEYGGTRHTRYKDLSGAILGE